MEHARLFISWIQVDTVISGGMRVSSRKLGVNV
jgi:hypothetical protein